jgi:hypothetical protein
VTVATKPTTPTATSRLTPAQQQPTAVHRHSTGVA